MSDEQFVSNIISRMLKDRGRDSLFVEYWQNPRRIDQIVNLASSCMNQMRRLVQFDTQQQLIATNTTQQLTAGATNPSMQTRSTRIRTAQTILAEMGFYNSTIDGISGPATLRALTAGMKHLGSEQQANVDNFLNLVLNPSTAAPLNPEQQSALSTLQSENDKLTAELAELRESVTNLNNDLEAAQKQLSAARNEPEETENEKIDELVLKISQLNCRYLY
jgi:outer membrane murein-binding lipoprotein Lpp